MSENNDSVSLVYMENIDDVLNELYTAYKEIPFGNSKFQNIYFVANNEDTPARAYRHIGLRLFNRIRALKEAYFNRKKEDIDLMELREKIADPSTSKFDRMRYEIDIERILSNRPDIDKLIYDALIEVNTLYNMYKKLPKYTGDSFEKEERLHYEIRLQKEVRGLTGALKSLNAMNFDITKVATLEQLLNQTNVIESTKMLSE